VQVSEERSSGPFSQLLPSLLEKLHLDRLDKGDLLLAAILFLLYTDSGEEEYLFALALLFLL